MIDILVIAGTGAVSLWGYLKARRFVRERLRFVDAAHVPAAPYFAGTIAALATGPIVLLLPWIGLPTALVFGVGVGLGTAHGSKDVRRALPGLHRQ